MRTHAASAGPTHGDAPREGPAAGEDPLDDTFEGSCPFDRVVLPVGGDAGEMEVQLCAVRLAARHGLPLLAVHVRTGPFLPAIDLFGYLEDLCRRKDVPWTAGVLEGNAVEELLSELHPTDLVVTGAKGLSRPGGPSGLAAELADRAPCRVRVLEMG